TEESKASASAAELAPDSNNAQVTVAPTDNQGIVSVSLSKRFFDDNTRDQCGGAYSVDASVDVGRVTDDSIEIRTVTYRYHPNANQQSPDAFMSSFSNGTPGNTVYTAGAEGEGDDIVQVFQINRVLERVRASDGGGAILHHRTRLAVNDRFEVCGMTMKIILQT
ncbi:MAG: hypothetical protein M3Z30_00220, partial [Gemmatimonadota bacterium]|nr:hypothetical protein [Gemmatimonadota bacterium]